MKRKVKTKKSKVRKAKAVKVKVEKPIKVNELFKHKKLSKNAPAKITGNHYYSETLATDEHGDPLVTQNTSMSGSKVIKTMIYDLKNNVVICNNYEQVIS
jgi:hypothetical protein